MKKVLIIVVLLLLLPATAYAENAQEITDGYEIAFTLSDEDISALEDGKVQSHVSLPQGEKIKIRCENTTTIMLKWYETTDYKITFYDNNNAEKRFVSYDNRILNQYLELDGAVSLSIELPNGGKLSDIIFYSEGEEESDTQIWKAPYKKTDVLVISAHPDDEYLFMGGTIPYYGLERGLHVTAVWMTHQRRLRQDEALAALWAMGVDHYPEFVGFEDRHSKTYKQGARVWGEEATLEKVVELYRKYKPEVVVTHDLKGEYGHGAHRVTAAMALKAARTAADKTQFPDSADKYGIWQIKKLYLHLYKENKIVMDWNQPLEAFEGKTALDMAKIGFSYHKSQHKYYFSVSDTSRNSCAKFGLAFTTVGYDKEKNDFLEKIPAEYLSNYVAPGPIPTAEPVIEVIIQTTPQPTKVPTPKPSAKPTATMPVSSEVSAQQFPLNWFIVIILVTGIVLVSFIIVLINWKAKKSNK